MLFKDHLVFVLLVTCYVITVVERSLLRAMLLLLLKITWCFSVCIASYMLCYYCC